MGEVDVHPGNKMGSQVLAKYRELIEAEEVCRHRANSDGLLSAPDCRGEVLEGFITTLYDAKFLIAYDWMSRRIWGERYLNDLQRLEKANLLTLRLLLSAAVRNERFCEGCFASLLTGGQLPAIMRCLGVISNELKSGIVQWGRVNYGPLPEASIRYLPRYDGFDRMYWADPRRLMAGVYPGDLVPGNAAKKLKFLVRSGIGKVINLMERDEVDHEGRPFAPYEPKLRRMAIKTGSDIETCRLQVKDMSVPTESDMKTILDAIDRALQEDRPVYLHCWGGHGRTGTVVGCCLVRHDIVRASEALKYLDSIRRDLPDGHKPSPQTPQQRSMVKKWRVGN